MQKTLSLIYTIVFYLSMALGFVLSAMAILGFRILAPLALLLQLAAALMITRELNRIEHQEIPDPMKPTVDYATIGGWYILAFLALELVTGSVVVIYNILPVNPTHIALGIAMIVPCGVMIIWMIWYMVRIIQTQIKRQG